LKTVRKKNGVFGHIPGKSGFTLVELLIALFVLQLVIAPLYLVFTSTRQTMFKAADTLVAAGLASSMIAGLRELPRQSLRSQPLIQDSQLVASFSLENLGVMPAPPEFTRRVEIIPATSAGNEGLYIVEVQIEWHNRNSETQVNYVVRNLLRGKE